MAGPARAVKSDLQGGWGRKSSLGRTKGQADGALRAPMARTRAGVAVRWRLRVLFRRETSGLRSPWSEGCAL